jgi:hypothetical protein
MVKQEKRSGNSQRAIILILIVILILRFRFMRAEYGGRAQTLAAPKRPKLSGNMCAGFAELNKSKKALTNLLRGENERVLLANLNIGLDFADQRCSKKFAGIKAKLSVFERGNWIAKTQWRLRKLAFRQRIADVLRRGPGPVRMLRNIVPALGSPLHDLARHC